MCDGAASPGGDSLWKSDRPAREKARKKTKPGDHGNSIVSRFRAPSAGFDQDDGVRLVELVHLLERP